MKRILFWLTFAVSFIATFKFCPDCLRLAAWRGGAVELVEQPWVDQAVGPAGVTVSMPRRLHAKHVELPFLLGAMVSESTTLASEAGGLAFYVSHTAFRHVGLASLNGAADGALANVRSQDGGRGYDVSKRETTVLGLRAIEFGATIECGGPLRVRGLVFYDGDSLYQLGAIIPAQFGQASEVWRRILGSIRRVPHASDGLTRSALRTGLNRMARPPTSTDTLPATPAPRAWPSPRR